MNTNQKINSTYGIGSHLLYPRQDFVGCRISAKLSNQTITTGILTTLNFDTVDFDTGGMADVSNNRIIIQSNGIYLISLSIISQSTLQPATYAELYFNESQSGNNSFKSLSSPSSTVYSVTKMFCGNGIKGETYIVRFRHNSGTNEILGNISVGRYSTFTIIKIADLH